jgi:hypothetical protein
MPPRSTAITGTAGEHFVAARLAGMGYVVALSRGGSPGVDLLIATQDGSRTDLGVLDLRDPPQGAVANWLAGPHPMRQFGISFDGDIEKIDRWSRAGRHGGAAFGCPATCRSAARAGGNRDAA